MTHKEIQREIQLLNSVIKQAKESLANAPEGKLLISTCRGQTAFRIQLGNEKLKYLSVKDSELIHNLAQKDYDSKIIKVAEHQLCLLNNLESEYEPSICSQVFEELHPERKKLVLPYIAPVSYRIDEWKKVVYKGKDFSDSSVVFYTRNGERVRSKSEVIIADTFDKYNVPYRYEFPVILNGYGTVYPDFSVINPRTGREFIFEHFGMIGDAEYEKNMNRKLEMYNSCGYFYGENFLYTFETKSSPLNMVLLNSAVKHFLT